MIDDNEVRMVSIATCVAEGMTYNTLYGVDRNGVVYRYYHSEDRWRPLRMRTDRPTPQ